MTRLIDAEELKEYLEEAYEAGCIDKYYNMRRRTIFDEVFDCIDEQPTVDAVSVIRCYECKHFREFEKGFSNDWDGSCKYWNTHSTVYSNFCGCAERKEE